MPITHFRGPNGEAIPVADAPDFFDNAGIAPAELVHRIVDRDVDRSGPSPYISPSLFTHTCRREILVSRFLPYNLDPLRRWMAYEGTAFHDAFLGAGDAYLHEVMLPADRFCPKCGIDWKHSSPVDLEGRCCTCPEMKWRPEHGDDYDHPRVRRCPEDGKLRYELFPGVWIRGLIDRIRPDWQDLTDLKTKRYSRTDYSARDMREAWAPQVNTYRVMVEDLKGVTVHEAWVWRLYRGAYDARKALQRFPVPRYDDTAMLRLAPFPTELAGLCRQAYDMHVAGNTDGIIDLIKSLPLDGERMFQKSDGSSNKCTHYCDVSSKCLQEISGKTAGHLLF